MTTMTTLMTAAAKRVRAVFVLACLLAATPSIAAAAPGPGDAVDLIGVRVVDVKGHHHRIGVATGKAQPAVLVFLDTACPVATRYVPTLNALHTEARAKGIALYGILSNPAITWQAGADFEDEFGIAFPVFLDSAGDLALRLGPRVMSEAFVISTADRIVYRGRIDDRFAAVGRLRTQIGSHDLRTVIEAIADAASRSPLRPTRSAAFTTTGARPARDPPRSPTTAISRRCWKPIASSATGRAASPPSPWKATPTRNAGTAWSHSWPASA